MNRDSGAGFWPQWEDNKLFALLLSILLVYSIVFIGVLIRKELLKTERIGVSDIFPPTINVTATDAARAVPNLATVDLGVTVSGLTSEKAAGENTVKTNAIIEAVKLSGVEPVDIKTANYRVEPEYDYNVSPAKIVSYVVNQTVTVKIRDLGKANDILAKAVSLGATNVSGLVYTMEEPAAIESEARSKAIAKAYEQARSIANSMGVTLGGVASYSEYETPMYGMYDGYGKGGAAPTLMPGETEVSRTVNLSFTIK